MARFYGASAGIDSGDSASVFTLTDAPAGMWTDVPDAKFVYYNGNTYFGYVDGSSGNVYIAKYHHADATVTTFNLHSALGGVNGSPDLHDSPSVLVRSSDHKIVVAYTAHQDSVVRVRISSSAEDISAFGSEITYGAAGGTYTYASLIELTSESKIYLWTRQTVTATGKSRQTYRTSSDNGATWSGTDTAVWIGPNVANKLNYRRLATNGTDRIDAFFTDTPRTLADPSTLYHVYYNGGHWYKSDGTDTGKTAFLLNADATVVKNTSDGPAAPLSCWYDGSNNPVTQILTYDGSSAQIRQARWSGSAWSDHLVADTNGYPSSNPFILCSALDHADVNRCYLPVKVGSRFEMFRYVSADSGATWTGTQLTSGSAHDNLSPDIVWSHASDLKAIWAYGDYTSNSVFDFGIRGGV